MKDIRSILTAVYAAVILLTGCQEEQFGEQNNSESYHACVETFGAETRTAIGIEKSIVWSSQDRIAIFEEDSRGQAYQILDSYAGKAYGDFSPVEGLFTEDISDPVYGTVAVYPYNDNLTVTSGWDSCYEINGVVFPSEQRYVQGSFADEAFPMATITTDGSKSLSFKNVGAVLKFSLTGSYSVCRITVTGNCGEYLSGPATVTLYPDDVPSVWMSSDASSSVALVCDPAVRLDPDRVTDFYISIPPINFWEGFTVTVTDDEGRNTVKSTEKTNMAGRSQILAMPGFTQNSLVLLKNTPDSNWDIILTDLNNTALCFSQMEGNSGELLAVMAGEYEIRMHFDEYGRPVSYLSEDMDVNVEYDGDNATYFFCFDGRSIIVTDVIEKIRMTKSGIEEILDFATGVAGTEEMASLFENIAEVKAESFDEHIRDFFEAMNFLKETNGLDALETTEYGEVGDVLTQFIDQVKEMSTHREDDDFINYTVGLKAGSAVVTGDDSASIELQGRIIGQSNGRRFDFEYGICYSATNQMPTCNDHKISNGYAASEGMSFAEIELPQWFQVSGLNENKYYYRAFFKDRYTGDIIYSDNAKRLEMSDDARWVDLGLSVLWAEYNVGAESPEEYGGYYAWGETEEKDSYTMESYRFYDPNQWESYIFIGQEISGTSYDVAHVKWGDGARMPNLDEMQELVDNCTFESGLYNGVEGDYVTGPNGNKIFLPYSGDRWHYDYIYGFCGYLWCGTCYEDGSLDAHNLWFDGNEPSVRQYDRIDGEPIRPVKDKKN